MLAAQIVQARKNGCRRQSLAIDRDRGEIDSAPAALLNQNRRRSRLGSR